MARSVALSLYRRTLKLLASMERVGAGRIAVERYAEYLPRGMIVDMHDGPKTVVRKAFATTSMTPEALASGFSFAKDAVESMSELELLALWSTYSRDGEYDLLDGLALMSAALLFAGGSETSGVGDLASKVEMVREDIGCFVREMRDFLGMHLCHAGSCGKELNSRLLATCVSALQDHGCCVSEGFAEDYAAVNISRTKRASVLVLNSLLLVVLRELGVPCAAVNECDLYRSWLRVQLPKDGGRRPLFLSFAHPGVHTAREVMHLNDCQHKSMHWLRSASWDGGSRKGVLSSLLKRQLMALSSSPDPTLQLQRLRQQRACRVQILFLLS